jgi:hypothetical protein
LAGVVAGVAEASDGRHWRQARRTTLPEESDALIGPRRAHPYALAISPLAAYLNQLECL